MTEHWPDKESYVQSLEIMKKVFLFDDAIGPRGNAIHIVIARIRTGWTKFRVLMILLASRGFPIRARYRLYSGCICSVMLKGSDTWKWGTCDQTRKAWCKDG